MALARQAGVHAASPLVVAAAVWGAVAVAVSMLGASLGRSLADLVARACHDADGTWAVSVTTAAAAPTPATAGLTPGSIVGTTLAHAAPILGAAAIAAVVAHLAQTRTLWMPRRRLDGAPAPIRSRGAHAAIELAGALVIAAVVGTWLSLMMPRLAALFEIESASGALVIAAILGTLTIVLVVIAALDAITRHLELAAGLRMTAAERKEDVRQAGIDPRWRRRANQRDELGHATVLILGNGVAVAVAWDPIHRPVPARIAVGHGTDATRLIGLARRDRVAVHRDVDLARSLATDVTPGGPIDESAWPRLAEIVAAVRREDGGPRRDGPTSIRGDAAVRADDSR